jgi:hypothetical protein
MLSRFLYPCAPHHSVRKYDEASNIHLRDALVLISEGCSKPQSTMQRRTSGLRRKSQKPDEWIDT